MEIIKQNETFLIEEINDTYETKGSITYEAKGSFNMHFNVKNLEGESLGDCQYHKYTDSNSVNFNVYCEEAVREELLTYANTVVSSVLEYFNK
jgi:hypothetical protein